MRLSPQFIALARPPRLVLATRTSLYLLASPRTGVLAASGCMADFFRSRSYWPSPMIWSRRSEGGPSRSSWEVCHRFLPMPVSAGLLSDQRSKIRLRSDMECRAISAPASHYSGHDGGELARPRRYVMHRRVIDDFEI